MMAATARTLTPVLTHDDVNARITAYVNRRVAPLVAAERVIDDLCREGLAAQLIALVGPPALFDFWVSGQPRQRAAREVVTQLNKRHQELAALKAAGSLLESMVEVGGRWYRLGDLTAVQLKQAAATHKRQALAVAQKARYYHAIAQRLQDGQRVRDRLDDAELKTILDEAGR